MGKRSEFVLKDAEVFVGLEDLKKSWKLCVRSGGVVVNETSMPADYENLRNYFNNKFPGCRIKVMYEAGSGGFDLHDQLLADDWECVVTPPHTVIQEKCSKQKNDRIDCRRLSKNLENSDCRSCHVPDKELREGRQISRTYGQVQKDIIRVCNRIRWTLEFHGLDRLFPPGRWSGAAYKQLKQKLAEMKISHSLEISFGVMFKELEDLRQLKKELLLELRNLGKSDRYRKSVDLLKSAPGIGMLTAIRLALEWGDMTRFGRKEAFAKFLGLIPGDYSSGEQDRRGHITKQGNRWVRSWLVEAAWRAIKYDPVLLDKFRRVYSHNGSKKKAIVAVARMLAMRLRRVLLDGKPYEDGLVSCN